MLIRNILIIKRTSSSYTIALLTNNVNGFRYISDAGRYPPASSFFSLCLNVISVMFAITVYVRYKQIEQFYVRRDRLRTFADRPHAYGSTNNDGQLMTVRQEDDVTTSKKIVNRNYMSLWVGWIAVLGIMILCNFRSGDVAVAHKLGAIICFTFGPLYCCYQTSLSYYMVGVVNTLRMARIRLTLSILMIICFANCVITGWMANNMFQTSEQVLQETHHYGLYLYSAINEWLLAVTFDLFILTFVGEMYKVSLSGPECRLHRTVSGASQYTGRRPFVSRSAETFRPFNDKAKLDTNFQIKSCEV